MLSWDEFDKEDSGEVAVKALTPATLPKPTWTASTAPAVPPPSKPGP